MEDSRSKRSHVRLDGPFPAEFRARGKGETTHTGQATELSAGGLFLPRPVCIYAVGTVLEIRIIQGDRGFVAEGEVVRAVPEGLGVRFLTTTELVSRLVLPEPSVADDQVEELTRLEESLGSFRVHYASVQEFRQDYSRHMKLGGFQIRTDSPLAIGFDVQLRVSVEGSGIEPVLLRGRVVARLPAGIGIEISNLQSTKEQLELMAAPAERGTVARA